MPRYTVFMKQNTWITYCICWDSEGWNQWTLFYPMGPQELRTCQIWEIEKLKNRKKAKNCELGGSFQVHMLQIPRTELNSLFKLLVCQRTCGPKDSVLRCHTVCSVSMNVFKLHNCITKQWTPSIVEIVFRWIVHAVNVQGFRHSSCMKSVLFKFSGVHSEKPYINHILTHHITQLNFIF